MLGFYGASHARGALLGPRTAEHLHDQLGAADIVLETRLAGPHRGAGNNLNPDDAGYSADVLADPKRCRRAGVQGTG
jgi:hypothetical protein